jgi:hypothetical protein
MRRWGPSSSTDPSAEREWAVDDLRVPYPVWSQWVNGAPLEGAPSHGGHRGDMIVLTESGYLLVVKPMDDPLA